MSRNIEEKATASALPTMRYFDVAEFCQALGIPITERYIKQQTIDGFLPCYRIGVANYYSEADVLAWIQSMRREGTATGGDAA